MTIWMPPKAGSGRRRGPKRKKKGSSREKGRERHEAKDDKEEDAKDTKVREQIQSGITTELEVLNMPKSSHRPPTSRYSPPLSPLPSPIAALDETTEGETSVASTEIEESEFYRPSGSAYRSAVWETFKLRTTEKEGEPNAKCDLCNKKFMYTSSTSTLYRHLANKHPSRVLPMYKKVQV